MKKLLILTLFILAACSKETPPSAECLQAQKNYILMCERQVFYHNKYNYAVALDNDQLKKRYSDSVVAIRQRKELYANLNDSVNCPIDRCD